MALTKVPSNLDATVAITQSASDNSTNVATTAYVDTAISNLVDGAPGTLNTLDEIAAALNDDAALNTTLTTSIATKLPLAGGTVTGVTTFTGGDGVVVQTASDTFLQLKTTGSGSNYIEFKDSGGSSGNIRYNHSTNILSVKTNGTDNRLVIDASGNVGIGTDSPTMPLSVQAASNAYAISMHGRSDGYSELYGASNDGSTKYSFLQSHSAQTKLYTLVNAPLLLGTNSTEYMRINESSGNVVINKGAFSSLPTGSKLNVFGDGEVFRLDGTGATSRTFRFRNVSTTAPGIITADGSLEIGTEDANTSIGLMSIRDIIYKTTKTNSTAGHHKFYSHNTEIVRIDGQHNRVGIGTDAPQAPLEVNGGVSMTGGWGRSMVLRHPFPVLVFQSEYSTDAFAGIGYDNSTGLKFYVNAPSLDVVGNSGANHAMTILDNKNVGIGTQSPHSKLQVLGAVASGTATKPTHAVYDASGNMKSFEHVFSATKGTTSGALNKTLVDVSGLSNFHQAIFIVEYGTRLQAVSDSVTGFVHRVYALNRFNGGTLSVTETTAIAGSSNSLAHALIDVEIVSNTQYRIRVEFSSSVTSSSFASGTIRAYGLSDYFPTISFAEGMGNT